VRPGNFGDFLGGQYSNLRLLASRRVLYGASQLSKQVRTHYDRINVPFPPKPRFQFIYGLHRAGLGQFEGAFKSVGVWLHDVVRKLAPSPFFGLAIEAPGKLPELWLAQVGPAGSGQ
jgi:hypothetical protein